MTPSKPRLTGAICVALGMWANWMVTGAKVGVAPGYRVDGLRFKCGPGGMGQECRARATFCKTA
jgi:hypothetical protein